MSDETLSWDLKLDADTSGGTKMDAVLGKLDSTMNLLGFHLGHIEENTRRATVAHKKHGDEAKGLMGALNRLVHQGMEPFLERAKQIAEFEFIRGGMEELMHLPGELAEKVEELGEEILATAAKAERFDASFKLALGQKPGGELLEYIEKVGHHTEFTQEQLKGMNLELAKSGFKGAGIGRGMEAAIDLAAMSSNPQEGGSQAIEALRRIMTTGKVEARQLMPFGINEDTLLAELSKETGLSAKRGTSPEGAKIASQLEKRIEAGRVSTDTLLNSLYTVITQKTGKSLGGAGADMENLFSTRLKNLKEIPDLIFEKMSKSSGFAAVSDWIAKIGDQFGVAGAQGTKILDALTYAMDQFGEALGGVDVDDLGEDIAALIRTTGDFAADLAADLGPAIRIFKQLEDIVMTTIHGLELGAHLVHDWTPLGYLYDSSKKSQAARVALAQSGALPSQQHFEGASGAVANAMNKYTPIGFLNDTIFNKDFWHRRGKDTADGLAGGMSSGAPSVKEAATDLAYTPSDVYQSVNEIHSPSRRFERLGRHTVEGLRRGIDGGADGIDASIARLTGVPVSAGGVRGGGIGGLQVTVAPHVVVHASPGMSAAEVGQIAAEKVVELAPGALLSAFEQMAMQTGSAA